MTQMMFWNLFWERDTASVGYKLHKKLHKKGCQSLWLSMLAKTAAEETHFTVKQNVIDVMIYM